LFNSIQFGSEMSGGDRANMGWLCWCCGDDGFSAAPKMLVQLAGAESWTNDRAYRGEVSDMREGVVLVGVLSWYMIKLRIGREIKTKQR
jgi:hypothetical protein